MSHPDRSGDFAPHRGAASSKIHDHHLQRKAIVYVRQSSLHQVLENRESTARQYALVDRAFALGWPRDRIEVIDDDQGCSGQSAEGRAGFQRLLAAISLSQVGIVLGLEMSRLARSNKDWHQLLEVCSVFRTLLADQDGLYDPTLYNDRLLLGLKGTMSEAELHILRGRLHDGRLNKALRGELFNHVPTGYIKLPTGEPALDPDEQVQSVIRLIFDQFDRQRSVHGLLRYLVKHEVKLGIRPHHGANRGQLEWHRPNRETLLNLLHHPIYAGYYRWGHRTIDPRRQIPGRKGTGRTVNKPKDCQVLIEGRCPAYISIERFEANQQRLEDNRTRGLAKGAVRNGPSLLGGLLVCGRCNRRLLVGYTGNSNYLRYSCMRGAIDYAEPVCLSLAGKRLDELVSTEVLKALQPAALELSLAAVEDVQKQRQQLDQNWQQQMQRASYEADRAARQYQVVDPDNRLVARELERRWEQALAEQRRLEEDYARFRQTQAVGLTQQERAIIRGLAEDIPGLWHAETTTMADRQKIVRLLVERVTVEVEGDSEQVGVVIAWMGGQASQHSLCRPVQRYEQLSEYGRLMQRIRELRHEGRTLAEVAEQLNSEGFRPPKRRATYNAAMVARLVSREERTASRPRAVSEPGMLKENEWLLSDLARELAMPAITLNRWIRVGWVNGRKLDVPGGHWAVWADAEEIARLKQLRAHKRSWSDEPHRVKLTTPKKPCDN
jgi:DNA invertase Pin-like site-specific DNA recombinase